MFFLLTFNFKLIFYGKSPRNCTIAANVVRDLKLSGTKKVGVFVNEPKDKLLQTVDDFGLDFVQLHGGESVAYCEALVTAGLKLIKVFSIDDSFDMNDTNAFQFCDYLLHIKEAEISRFLSTVTDWEHKEYFEIF